jgi:hypothetical protein
MNVVSNFVLFYHVEIASCNAFDVFENLTMNKGALTWVENFWSYNAKAIIY